uniref:Sec23/Sec24 trunk domain containing protein n=2 Tax=Hirondellea gigas TaxID=1518452 RepID=A0A6A7G8Q6_9CRUS
MNFASKFVNLDYDSDEDDLELSDSEMDHGFDALGYVDSESEDDDDHAPRRERASSRERVSSRERDRDSGRDRGRERSRSPERVGLASSSLSNDLLADGDAADINRRSSADGRGGVGGFFSSVAGLFGSNAPVGVGPPPSRPPASGAASMPAMGPPPPPVPARAAKPIRSKKLRKAKMVQMRAVRQDLREQTLLLRKSGPAKSRRRQHVNTNVVSVSLGSLAVEADQLQTGDPEFCSEKGCRCLFNSASKLNRPEDESKNEGEPVAELPMLEEGQRLWHCEFCGKINAVDVEDEEMPKGESQDYILEPAPAMEQDKKVEDDRLMIFCIDISGSMCVSKEVPGKFKLKGDHTQDLAALNENHEDQFMPNQNRNTTWVSRLQAVQAAVNAQLEILQKTRPKYRVGLVTFARDVTIYGDGTTAIEVVAGDKLADLAKLQDIGRKYALEVPIEKSMNDLAEKLFGLEESGPTALGPGLAVAVAMASVKNGSEVILCTDGLANVGLGTLDASSDAEKEKAENWYEGMGNYASMNGVTVNVISISDEECQLENVGRVADMTGGSVDKIDSLQITHKFSGILQNPVIATNVNATMFVHRGLRLRTDDEDETVVPAAAASSSSSSSESVPAKKKNPNFVVDRVSRDIGNVTKETEIFFEYSIRKDEMVRWKHLSGLPFQVQIQYTRLDGSRCIRVITQVKEITHSKEEAEADVDIAVMAANAVQKSAQLAQKGDYESSRAVNFGHAMYMDRVASKPQQQAALRHYVQDVSVWDRSVQRQQQTEAVSAPNMAWFSKSMKKKGRARMRNDDVSKQLFNLKSNPRNAYVDSDSEED